MFIRTLGLKTDGRVTEFVREKLISLNSIITSPSDKRGKAAPRNKKCRISIQDHIETFNPQISHYNREHSPNCRYLDHDLTITAMWEDYKVKISDVSYPVYCRVFETMNIGFGRPSQDDCDVCARQTAHQASPGEGHDAETCAECEGSRRHMMRYVNARKAYQDDANSDNRNQSLFTADMQKVILLPKMTTKEHFFVSRLVVFNATFASMNEEVDFAVLWHKGSEQKNQGCGNASQ